MSAGWDPRPGHHTAPLLPNLSHAELKPWPRRGGCGVHLNHVASRFERLLGLRDSARQEPFSSASAMRGNGAGSGRPRLDRDSRTMPAGALPSNGRRAPFCHRAQLLASAFQRRGDRTRALCCRHQWAAVINIADDPGFVFNFRYDFKNRFNGEAIISPPMASRWVSCCTPNSFPMPSICR
jgi:hypothetical protein